jgi:GH25 family lysozyme M1 (1,4-beta-N-acetylmuramidase)
MYAAAVLDLGLAIGRCRPVRGAAVIGVDYASVDSNEHIDWGAAARAGVDFAIVRGAYGAWIDPTLKRDWNALAAAGLVRGAYLYLRCPRLGHPSPATPQAQALALVRAIQEAGPRSPFDLPPTVDVEFPGNGRVETGLTAVQAVDWVMRAWRTLRDAFGVAPIVYTSARVWKEDLANLPATELAESPAWLARYPFKTRIGAVTERGVVSQLAWPPVPPPWGDASNVWIHQYQGDALRAPGFGGTVDLNRFRSMARGATGDRVRWVQRRLGRSQSGTFDADLDKVVRTFQRMSGLDQDGIIGPRTFAALCWSHDVVGAELA